jgi:hypothetical protein
LVWWLAIARASEVTVSIDRYRDLAEPPALEPAPAPFVERRDVTVRAEGDELVVTARFRVSVPEPGPVAFVMAGPELRVSRFTVDGRVTALGGGAGGPVFAAALQRPVELVLVGTVDRGDRAVVSLLGAGAGEVSLPSELALVDGLALGAGVWVPAAPDRTLDTLVLEVRPPPASDRGELVLGRVGYGITALDGELRRAARLQWRVVSGTLTRVAFRVPGAGPDLVVEGPQVGEVTRVGDRVEVTLAGEESTLVDLTVHTSSALGTGEVTTIDLGLPVQEGVFRTEATVVLARDGELDLVPRLTGMAARSVLQLPAVTTGLLDGSPTAAFQGFSGAGQLDVLRFTPAEGPATLCDVATYTYAMTDDGRGLLRAHWTVRNDRGHLLHVTPPAGYAPIAAQVSGRPVTVSREGDTWLVPLDKSVESVQGLLSFPVEVAFLGEEPAVASRRLRRSVTLPSIDAETAVVRATVHLPPGFADRTRPGEGDRVDGFTEGEGITYGFAVGDARAAQAEALFQEALASWNENEFEDAQARLDAIKALGGENDNTVALEGNLRVVSGKKGEAAGVESAIDRRIKDQARARAIDDFEAQRELLEAAEQATNEGRYDEAERAYSSASAVTEKLAKLSNVEDVAQSAQLVDNAVKNQMNVETSNRKTAYRSQAMAGDDDGRDASTTRQVAEEAARNARAAEESVAEVDGEPEPEFANGFPSVDLEDEDVSGELPMPQPITLAPRPSPAPPPSHAAGPQRPSDPKPMATAGGGRVSGAVERPPLVIVQESRIIVPDPDRPAVVATSASVIVPTHGVAVNFQHLLLPVGARLQLPLDARRESNHRSRSRSHP